MIDILMDEVYGATIGRVGENKCCRILIPISHWLELYPDATFGLLYKSPDADSAYPIADFTHDENYIYWIVTSAELAKSGTGSCEVSVYSGNAIAKSKEYTVKVMTALGSGGKAPKPWNNWEKTFNTMKAEIEAMHDEIKSMYDELKGGDRP